VKGGVGRVTTTGKRRVILGEGRVTPGTTMGVL